MHGYESKYPLISRGLTISFRYTHTKKLSSKCRIQKIFGALKFIFKAFVPMGGFRVGPGGGGEASPCLSVKFSVVSKTFSVK